MSNNFFLNQSLFTNGGETYSYSTLRAWLIDTLGLTARQAAGTVGAGVRYGYIAVSTCAKNSALGEATFVR